MPPKKKPSKKKPSKNKHPRGPAQPADGSVASSAGNGEPSQDPAATGESADDGTETRPPTHFNITTNGDNLIGEETNPVTRTFGHLAEGFEVGPDVSAADLERLRERYHRRRNIAELGLYPEGYEFQHAVAGGQQRTVTLLSPPDMTAIGQDGNWQRRPRVVNQDGPWPYPMEWYMDHLDRANLPRWFLRPEHIECIENNAEADWLEVDNEPTMEEERPPPNYLETRYPVQPQYPVPDPSGTGTTYSVTLDADTQHRIARRFPAANSNALQGEYRIYVVPSGHIIIRPTGLRNDDFNIGDQLLPLRLLQWRAEDPDNTVASYLFDHNSRQPAVGATTSHGSRQDEVEAAGVFNGLVNPDQIPHGLGTWEWLNEGIDRPLAESLNLLTPEEVGFARIHGGLMAGMRRNTGPMVVFYPDDRYFNPPAQGTRHGHWQYITTGSRALARMNFGGQADFPDNPDPDAAQIQEVRRRYRDRIAAGELQDDPTNGIDIVWVPTRTPTPGSTAPPPPTTPRVEPPERVIDDGIGRTDPHSGLTHEPRNRDENDQRGVFGATNYQTREINGKKFTVDRARAHAGPPEPHKSWALDKKGQWKQWTGYSTINWNDQNSVEAMNKWREQVYSRGKWPLKREAPREDYTQEQREWLLAVAKKNNLARPSEGIAKLCADFNKRFKANRKESGISAAYDRVVKEFKKHGKLLEHNGKTGPRPRPQTSPKVPEEESEEGVPSGDDGSEYED